MAFKDIARRIRKAPTTISREVKKHLAVQPLSVLWRIRHRTESGGEFANVFAFILGLDGKPETDLFFCDPYQSSQKPKAEKNHTLFRDIVPKGESFDHFTQETVNLIFSHVNSIKRKSLNGKTPYEVFSFMFGESITSLLGIEKIPAYEVVQSPKLLKNRSN